MNRLPVLALAVIFLSGCVGNVAYRLEQPVIHERNDVLHVNYSLAFVEFDDMGEMFDSTELDKAVAAIIGARQHDTIVLLFVHGWKNNAAENNGNVWGFRDELANLARKDPKQNVVGVYIGWRGSFTSFKLIQDFTYWNRFDAANRIPGPHLTEAINRVVSAAKDPKYGNPSYIIAIGHSFGGLVLERTVAQAMVPGVVRASLRQPLAPEEELFPDLTILLNEAGPAMQAKPLLDALDRAGKMLGSPLQWVDQDNNVRPLLLSMTSTGDTATRIAFPIGQGAAIFRPWFLTSIRSYPQPDQFGTSGQWSYWIKTTANTPALNSHAFETTVPGTDRQLYASVSANGQCFNVIRHDLWKNQTPYWAMQLPPQFVPDHGTIFEPQMISLLDTFLFPPKSPQACPTTSQNLKVKTRIPAPAPAAAPLPPPASPPSRITIPHPRWSSR